MTIRQLSKTVSPAMLEALDLIVALGCTSPVEFREATIAALVKRGLVSEFYHDGRVTLHPTSNGKAVVAFVS